MASFRDLNIERMLTIREKKPILDWLAGGSSRQLEIVRIVKQVYHNFKRESIILYI
ncbi:hypothetical protein RJD24_20310 [Bacillaceae bacterium IKA-2]|nr:hypothetical protein RJD24_20310 [Bacillaceae bacterium IKA-2]